MYLSYIFSIELYFVSVIVCDRNISHVAVAGICILSLVEDLGRLGKFRFLGRAVQVGFLIIYS